MQETNEVRYKKLKLGFWTQFSELFFFFKTETPETIEIKYHCRRQILV